jgi:hypothetical protein
LAVSVDLTGNTAPAEPVLTGQTQGKTQTSYSYTISATDVDDDALTYFISWGDGTVDEWIGPYESGEEIQVEHTWSQQGDYVIKVRAKDSHDVMGPWTRLEIMMPRSYHAPLSFLQHVFDIIYDMLSFQ